MKWLLTARPWRVVPNLNNLIYVRSWPEADGRGIGDEWPLLRKADVQSGDFPKYVGE